MENKFLEESRGYDIRRLPKNLILSLFMSLFVISIFYVSTHADAYMVQRDDQQAIPATIISVEVIPEEETELQTVPNFDTEIATRETSIIKNILEIPNSVDDVVKLGCVEKDILIIEETVYQLNEQPIILDNEINIYFSGYVDIGSNNGVTAEMLDNASAYFQKYQSFENKFVNQGWIFIEAQKQSGIDALWLYAVAVYESGWGTSRLAIENGNYYGIGAWDSDISKAKVFTTNNSLYDGIVGGAIWIAENYYQQGYTTMYMMNSEPYHSYAPDNTVWIPTISDFINTFYYRWRTKL